MQLTSEDIQDLSTFFNLPEDKCVSRVKSYRFSEMAEAWRTADTKTPAEIRRFYESTDLYIWELTQWHAEEASASRWEAIEAVIRNYPPSHYPLVFDYGCGIGSVAIRLAEAGYQVTVADVPGRTLDFALHRFARRELKIVVLEVRNQRPKLPQPYDILVCFDVLEHIPQPDHMLFHLTKPLRVDGVAVIQASFGRNEEFPHHLVENWLRFGKTNNWWLACNAAGLREIEPNLIYRRVAMPRVVFRRLRYWVWQRTGLFVMRIPRYADDHE